MTLSELRARITDLGLTQKEVAVRVVNALASQTPMEDVKLSTVEGKLSKARSAEPEGIAFFKCVLRLNVNTDSS